MLNILLTLRAESESDYLFLLNQCLFLLTYFLGEGGGLSFHLQHGKQQHCQERKLVHDYFRETK